MTSGHEWRKQLFDFAWKYDPVKETCILNGYALDNIGSDQVARAVHGGGDY